MRYSIYLSFPCLLFFFIDIENNGLKYVNCIRENS
jgi:hypothetical protein